MTRRVESENLVAMLKSARQRTLELVAGLTPEQWLGPKLTTVNPPQWEIGHVGWFQEYFALRRVHGCKPLLERGDALYDSIAIAHDRRWDLPLYTMEETLDYLVRLRERMIERLDGALASEVDSFNYLFTTFHEDMHDEAFLWTWQALGYATPVLRPDGSERIGKAPRSSAGVLLGDAKIPGGTFQLGSTPDEPFLFDNEKWAHRVQVAPFRMARTPVTNAEFQAFVEEGGYTRREWWDEEGWAWKTKSGALHPVYWRPDVSGRWQMRSFDTWGALPPLHPVSHVSWHEANAYCRFAGRRLPTEAEWEFAATMRLSTSGELQKARYPWGDDAPSAAHANLDGFALGCVDVAAHPEGDNAFGVRQLLGNIWEWTQDTFTPFPGFSPDAYKEYSEPLFGKTKVLRGGAWTTRSRMIRSAYRNYFEAERRDIFAGFRTCAVD